MRVPLLDLRAQLDRVRDELRSQVDDVLDSCMFINGPKVTSLEEQIAGYCGAKRGIGVSSGTDALLVALMALDIGPGDAVLTTPYSFFSTAGAIARLGARPVFVDIDRTTYNISVDAIREALERSPGQLESVKAIIPVHLYGQCADMDPIIDISRENNWYVVEDAAQAIGSKYRSGDRVVRAGSMGDVGCFSFFPSKNLGGAGDGGMVVTSDEALADKLVKLRNHGSFPKYYNELIGGNFRLDALQAAVLLAKLPHLDQWHAERQANAAYYDERLASIDGIVLPQITQDRSFHIYNQYVIATDRRDELRSYMTEQEIGTEIYYPVPFHLQRCFSYLNYKPGDFPAAEYASVSTLAIPVYPELTRPQQDRVVAAISDFFGDIG